MKERTLQNFDALARQSLGRDLEPAEVLLSQALEAQFRAGVHDPAAIAAKFNENSVMRPSGSKETWTEAVLIEELRAANSSLDHAYENSNRQFPSRSFRK